VGGTTTDIALIEAGQVAVSEEGASVSDYKTSVRAANLLSIALGGDSHITWGPEKRLVVGPERVTPLAYLAWRHPRVASQLEALSMRTWSQATPDWLEYWFLLRQPGDGLLAGQRERELVGFLGDGPRPLPEILKRLKVLHVAQIGVAELVRQEVIGKAGLTSTDLMHIEERFDIWDAQASAHAWKVFCQFQFKDPDELRQEVWTRTTEMIVHAVVTFLSQHPLELADRNRSLEGVDTDFGRWLFYNSLYRAHPHLETLIRLRQPIIGIGAPAGIFLPAVAQALHTELILPDHHQVANAVGAIAGSVMVEEELLIYPKLSRDGLEVFGYYVQTHDERLEFEELDGALAHARALSQERALGAAIRSGADEPRVTLEETTDGLDTFRVRARAVGNPRLTR
jgi:N-methylhydantoinase A/oxoprolinase/acetone carboxylase beta subunit